MHWNIKEIEVAELSNWLETGEESLRVIDVRQPAEIAAGTVPKAEAMPMHTIPLRVNELNKDEKLVLVCRSGARSAQACAFLQQQGYDNVYNLRGGMMGWAGSGLPVNLPEAI
ncbi:MAG: rhodanese-like domain-containing protein [Thioalkalispiraceae bacterium]|jgi:rhodanese-related sulfurtransferase